MILASTAIGEGDLNIKVPETKTDKDLEKLNKNFNSMINRLKNQQDKLIINERHEAWESLARKLAHEIKNPLTPIQLSIDRIKEKYLKQINQNEKQNFDENLKIINNQIKQIGNLVNEFSDFARMPKPILKKNDLSLIIENNIKLLSTIDTSIKINLISSKIRVLLESDKEQINRVIFNLIKNSIESIQQKAEKTPNLDKIINIEIYEKSNQIYIIITDNGLGFGNFSNNLNEILKPYVTTKKNGTGLGLSIVNKIINDHNGKLNFFSIPNGAKVEIVFN